MPEGEFVITALSKDKPLIEVTPELDRTSLTSFQEFDLTLNDVWSFWVRERKFGGDFKESLQKVSTVKTAHGFMAYYCHAHRPSKL